MTLINKMRIVPISMINYENKQRVNFYCNCDEAFHCIVNVYNNKRELIDSQGLSFAGGVTENTRFMKAPTTDIKAVFEFVTEDGILIYSERLLWKKPRQWNLYVMVSSHTDIGLHNSQYVQRLNSGKFINEAVALCDATEKDNIQEKYRYVMEGTWFWNNYGDDYGKKSAKHIVDNYIKTGKIGLCGGVAGNHTQVYGMEELCRSTYEKKDLKEKWDIDSETISMIDNNGLSWAMIQPYVQVGYKNIIFAPNQWNPIASTVWKTNTNVIGYKYNPQAGGGGSRIDFRYDSNLPMVFYWSDKGGNKLLVWGSTQYEFGGSCFGLISTAADMEYDMQAIENSMSAQLCRLESTVPYDVWMFPCYYDDEKPNLKLNNVINEWNRKWKWPKIHMLGKPELPFDLLRKKFDKDIPVLFGDITGGWYQHPLSAPELLAFKFHVHRMLPTAEKLSVLSAMINEKYRYPDIELTRGWKYLLFNDEHSYGTSGYQGRKVYETWMQHRDWLNKANESANKICNEALKALAEKITSNFDGVVVFNPTLSKRSEYVQSEYGFCLCEDIPSFGYKCINKSEFVQEFHSAKTNDPPVVENKFYKIKFNERGSIASIYDKCLKRELLDVKCEYGCNEFVYTSNNHITFYTPIRASFKIITNKWKTVVVSKMTEDNSRAEIEQEVSILNFEKRIDIKNTLKHVKDLYNNHRYYRYCYFAFPFYVENSKRFCNLNGCVAEYAMDVTGHGTDVYMACDQWCCAQNNEFGVALIQQDSHIVEFDHIHPDKTDFAHVGDSSKMYAYVANDWLQMHYVGGSHINFEFKYSILSYNGNYNSANVDMVAENCTNPILLKKIKPQKGILPLTKSFADVKKNARFLTLKRAENGRGIIARIRTIDKISKADVNFFSKKYGIEQATVDEQECQAEKLSNTGFVTFRIGADEISILNTLQMNSMESQNSIGNNYTGLITKPMAARGEHSGQLYLLWGASNDQNFSHYELFRSTQSNFIPNSENFIAKILPEEYRVARYEDLKLEEHKMYYYRVRAVNQDGKKGNFSDEFCGMTKEPIKQN